MLSDYKRYLLKIRNSLVRCGVDLDVKDVQDYTEIFYLGEKLSDLLWFYSVLEISGSEDRLRGFLFPLNSFYKSSLRDKYFEDYLLFRAGYMEISASDAIMRSNLEEVKEEKISEPVPNTISFIQNMQSKFKLEEEDEFVGTSEDDEFEDDFGSWGSSYEEELEEVELDDDEFVSYDSSEDDEFIEYNSEDGEEFSKWGNSEEGDDFIVNSSSEDEGYEDDFSNWGSSDGEEEVIDNTEEIVDDEDDFGNWGSSEDEEEFIEDTQQGEYEEEEDSFGTWGSDDVEDEEDFSNQSEEVEDEEYEDSFGSWGNFEEDDNQEIDEQYGEEEEDAFGSWGSSEESDTDCEDQDGNDFGSWGESSETSDSSKSQTIIDKNSNSKKSKLDYEIESNEKTAKVIERIASGIFSKGGLFKSKVSEKFKNMEENQD